MKVIRENTFSSCEKLEKIIIPPSVVSIESCALDAGKALKDVYIPASVQDIHEYAFLCSSNVTIHTSAGSCAEAFAKKSFLSWDNHVDGIWDIGSEEPPYSETTSSENETLDDSNSEKDAVNMYVILTNEWKLGRLNRSADGFYMIYGEDFAPLTKAEVINLRRNVLMEMKDKSRCVYYAASFKQRSVAERFNVATRNLNNVSTEPEVAEKAIWAIKNTRDWYQESELPEVRNLMKKELAHNKADLDRQLAQINDSWTKFATGKDFLQIVISNKKADNSDVRANFSNFQVVIGAQLVEVKIATKEKHRRSTTLMNCFPWYWGVTVRDIWETAIKNEILDTRKFAYDGQELANHALNQIREKYPVAK